MIWLLVTRGIHVIRGLYVGSRTINPLAITPGKLPPGKLPPKDNYPLEYYPPENNNNNNNKIFVYRKLQIASKRFRRK